MMIKRVLVLTRASGVTHEASAKFSDQWSDAKTMEFLVPLMRSNHKVEEGDSFKLLPIDPTKD